MAVTSQPGKNLIVIPSLGTREWTTGLCFFYTNCLRTCCCLPCLMCQVARRMDECCLMPCLFWITLVAMRTELRILGGIKGSICNDCLSVLFCFPCVVCQLSRELDSLGM